MFGAERSSRCLQRFVRKVGSVRSAEALCHFAELCLASWPFFTHQLREFVNDQCSKRRDVVFIGGSKHIDVEHQAWASLRREDAWLIGQIVDMADHSANCLWVIVFVVEADLIAGGNLLQSESHISTATC